MDHWGFTSAFWSSNPSVSLAVCALILHFNCIVNTFVVRGHVDRSSSYFGTLMVVLSVHNDIDMIMVSVRNIMVVLRTVISTGGYSSYFASLPVIVLVFELVLPTSFYCRHQHYDDLRRFHKRLLF